MKQVLLHILTHSTHMFEHSIHRECTVACLCILGIALSQLGFERVSRVACKEAQRRRQQTGIVVEADSDECDKQALL